MKYVIDGFVTIKKVNSNRIIVKIVMDIGFRFFYLKKRTQILGIKIRIQNLLLKKYTK